MDSFGNVCFVSYSEDSYVYESGKWRERSRWYISIVCYKDSINFQTQSGDPIRRHGKPSRADQWMVQRIRDFIGPLNWFPVATDRIVWLSPKLASLQAPIHNQTELYD